MRTPPDIWRIAIPDSLLEQAIRWYHQVLNHPGMDRMKKTIAAYYWHPNLESMVKQVVSTCDPCLRYKLPGVGYGELPPRVPELLPWREVIVDLIGPWPLPKKVQGKEITIHALTCIDPVSNLCEIIQVPSTKSNDVAIAFQNSWLSRYPWPSRCIHDRGGEFEGPEFQNVLLAANQIINAPIGTATPTAQAILERSHQTMGNIIRTLCYAHPPTNPMSVQQIVDTALATTMHSLNATYNKSVNAVPGTLVYGRDMFLDLPVTADWVTIQSA